MPHLRCTACAEFNRSEFIEVLPASPFFRFTYQKFIQCYLALCGTLFIFILNIFLCFQSVEKMTREVFYEGWN